MQALARQAVAEVVHGISTGIVVWAGGTPCSPTLVCVECPDCHCSCQDGVRAQPSVAASGDGILGWLVVVALALGIVGGFIAGRASVTPARRPGKGGRGVVLQLE